MGGLAPDKPWIPLTAEAIAAIPAQLGVYEIGVARAGGADAGGGVDDAGAAGGEGGFEVVRIGYAGGREPFGMRSALGTEREAGTGSHFRCELTHGYLTRWEELLMLHQASDGRLPAGNRDRLHPIGRLRP